MRRLLWVPAHSSEHDIGVKVAGNGHKFTAVDRGSDSLAAKLAKLAVEEHRVPPLVFEAVGKHFRLQEDLVRWVGTVGHLAKRSDGGAESRHECVP